MKCLVILFLTFFSISCTSQKSESKTDRNSDFYSGQITFTDTIVDFGIIKRQDEPYTHYFNFMNTGNVPVVILHVVPSCRCTTVEYNKTPVTVNGKDSIQVLFNSMESGMGYFNKAIKIRINSTKVYSLTIHGKVVE